MQPEAIKEAVTIQFASLLAEAGTNADEPDLFRTWEAFKRFAQVQVEQTHGFLMFEAGLGNSGGDQNCFFIQFIRNLYLEVEEGWDDVMVHCAFEFNVIPDAGALEVALTVDAGATPDAALFIAQVEAHLNLWQQLRKHSARQGKIYVGSQ